MKKIVFLLGVILILFTGCIGEEDYINSVKAISFNNGMSVEDIVNKDVEAIEFSQLNNLEENRTNPLFLINFYNTDFLSNLKMPSTPELKWEIEGKTKTGKIVVAYNEKVKIKIQTREDGDYIQVSTDEINVYSQKNNKAISSDTLNFAIEIYDLVNNAKEAGIIK